RRSGRQSRRRRGPRLGSVALSPSPASSSRHQCAQSVHKKGRRLLVAEAGIINEPDARRPLRPLTGRGGLFLKSLSGRSERGSYGAFIILAIPATLLDLVFQDL